MHQRRHSWDVRLAINVMLQICFARFAHICVYMYFGLHDLYVCAFPLWFARFAQPTQWQDSTMERTCIDVFCTSYFPLRQQLSRQKRNSTCRYVFPILWVMPRLAQENSTRNINVRRCWWSNRSELALHHIFEWVNGGKSSLMSLGPAEIISADIFLQSATPWGGRRGHLSTICTMLGAKQIDLNHLSIWCHLPSLI